MPVCYVHGTPLGSFVKLGRYAMPQCRQCGFLGRNTEDGVIVAADEQLRNFGRLPMSFASGFGISQGYPICCRGIKDFGGGAAGANNPERLLGLFQEEHDCQQFFLWERGLSPKDHLEMKLLAEVERRTTAWRTEDNAWQKQQEAIAETRHQELRRDNRTMATWALIIALAAAIIGGLISRQWN